MLKTLKEFTQTVAPPAPGREKASANETKDFVNPYLAARRQWDEHYGEFVESANRWRKIALINSVTCVIAVAALLVDVYHPRPPFVAVVGADGRNLGSGFADRRLTLDDHLKMSYLSEWVSNLRMVTSDGWVQRTAINAVYAKIDNGSAAREFINDFYRKDPPQKRAQSETVHVEVSSVLPLSDNTYQVDWIETTRDLQGKVESQKRWKGAFTLTFSPPNDEKAARLNPLGMYVTQARWNEVLSGEPQ